MNRMSNGISIAACGRSTVPKKAQSNYQLICACSAQGNSKFTHRRIRCLSKINNGERVNGIYVLLSTTL